MDNEIKLTMEAEEPKAPSLTLEGAPALTLDPQQQEQQAKPAVLDETVLSPEEQKVVDDFAQKIDITNSTLVLQYGSAAQKKIAGFSDTALDKVRTKDLGE